MKRERLTPHQGRILVQLKEKSAKARARSRPAGYADSLPAQGWVHQKDIGAAGACWHLVAKGWADQHAERGPRGGTHLWFRPIET